ncbi:TetR family transcriptional regulator C-terminal domain-containing protein, partial [Yersinia pestis]
AAKGMAGLIDGLWLRSALSGEHFNRQEALLIIHNYIEQQLNIKYKC